MNSQPLFQSRGWEFPGVLADEDSALPLLWLVVTAVARVQSPAQELLHAVGTAITKKVSPALKEEEENSFIDIKENLFLPRVRHITIG